LESADSKEDPNSDVKSKNLNIKIVKGILTYLRAIGNLAFSSCILLFISVSALQ